MLKLTTCNTMHDNEGGTSSATSVLVTTVRDSLRRETNAMRHKKRNVLLGQCRGLETEETNISPMEMTSLAVSVRKRGGAVDGQVLRKIQHGLLLGPEHVAAFISTDGALIGLVRILAGLNPALKCKATYCLCNLSLIGGKTALKITKHASAYLLVEMDSSNSILQDACTWTIGNLAASGNDAWNLLYSQGACARITQLLCSPYEDVVKSAIYALTHFLVQGRHQLRCEELEKLTNKIAPLIKQENVGYLLFLLSSMQVCDQFLYRSQIPENVVAKIQFMFETADLAEIDAISEITFLIRTVANICSESQEIANLVSDKLLRNRQSVQCLISNTSVPHLKDEISWFLNNLLQYRNIQNQLLDALS